MAISEGRPEIVIGVIDGPVDFNHHAFRDSKIRTVSDFQLNACKRLDSIACKHGTSVIGILCASRDSAAPAICPGCQIMLRPIFNETHKSDKVRINLPVSTAEELASAIVETVDAGAKIINLSLGLSTSSLIIYQELQQAYDYALRKGVAITAAAGNQGSIGYTSILNHHWVLPVAASDEDGRIHPISNFGPSIAKRGLMGPGVNIPSTSSGGGFTRHSGTSFAVPFLTGTIALLWSIFPKATATNIMNSIKMAANRNPRTVIPPLLNAQGAFEMLKRQHEISTLMD